MDVRFHALVQWPQDSTPTEERRSRYAFRSSWTQTLNLLDYELRNLDAHDIVIEAGFTPGDIRTDGWPRADARPPAHPGIILSFGSKHGPLRYVTDRYEHWQANVRAVALGLEALRAVDRYGITYRAEQYQGWAQLPSSTDETPMSVLLRVTGLDAVPPAENVRSLYRKALGVAHPDKGGNAEMFARVQEAGKRLGLK